MKTLLAAIAITAVLALPTTANAAWIHDASGNTIQPFARWTATAKLPAPNIDITVHLGDNSAIEEGRCGGVSSYCMSPGNVYIDSVMYDGRWFKTMEWEQARIWFHELGHNVDAKLMTDDDRAEFMRLRYMWGDWVHADVTDHSAPNEQFADAYSVCATYGPTAPKVNWVGFPVFFGDIGGYNPSPARHKKICALIRRITLR